MKPKIKQTKIKKMGILCFLCVYFMTKLLWDSIPYIFELFSIGLIAYGAARAFTINIHKRKVLIILSLLLSLYVLANAFLQDSSRQIQRAIYEYVFYMLIFWGAYYWGRNSKVEDWAGILLKVGIVVCLLSWLEYLSHCYILSNTIKYSDYTAFRAIVFSRTFLAHGMVLAFFAILSMYMYLIHKKNRHIIYTIFSFATIFTTGSRGAIVACTVGLYLMVLLFTIYQSNIKKLIFFLLTILLIVFLCILLTSNFSVGNATIDYFINRFRSILNWSSDDGNTGRIVIWKYYCNIFKNHIWFGIGPSQTGSWNLAGKYGATESGILKRLCELGIVGALLHYSFVFDVFFKGIGVIKKKINDMNLIFYFGLFIAVFVDDLTLQATEEIIVAFMMWFALAGIESSYNRRRLEE